MSDAAKKTTGLRQAQVRVLAALAGADAPMTRGEIAAGAKCDRAGLTEQLGSDDPDRRAANDAKHFPSLLSLKLVKAAGNKDDGPTAYVITAAGRKALAKAEQEAAK